jgi:hypothetical protein
MTFHAARDADNARKSPGGRGTRRAFCIDSVVDHSTSMRAGRPVRLQTIARHVAGCGAVRNVRPRCRLPRLRAPRFGAAGDKSPGGFQTVDKNLRRLLIFGI